MRRTRIALLRLHRCSHTAMLVNVTPCHSTRAMAPCKPDLYTASCPGAPHRAKLGRRCTRLERCSVIKYCLEKQSLIFALNNNTCVKTDGCAYFLPLAALSGFSSFSVFTKGMNSCPSM